MSETRPEQMFIYVIRAGAKVKIGRSSDPEYRCAKLQTGNPDKLELCFAAPVIGDGRMIETEAHDILVSNRIRQNGEWFDVTPEVAIAAIRSAAELLNQPLFNLE